MVLAEKSIWGAQRFTQLKKEAQTMTRKLSPLAVAALTGALGFGTTPVWSGGNSDHRQNQDQITMEQSTEGQTHIDENWNGTAETEMSSQQSSGVETSGRLDDQTMAQLGMKDDSSEPSSTTYEGTSAESEGEFGRSADSDVSSNNSAETSPVS